ncbi:YbaN family protein [Comamonas koreensis]|uniref:YbaN family protein n=1 Tax=Comamonas koreensis TaxID=160825 RepID=UPI0015FC86AB|nr:YbaN family protein [Comamonas koreensis]
MNEPGASSTALQDVQTPAYCPIRSPVLRWLLLLAAVACLAMGIVGIFVPGLPTTVFVLMAGACAARSSSRLHAWLWHHRLFGGMLRNWAAGGFVSRKAKWSASITMALCAVIMLLVPAPGWAKLLSIGCMACVLAWLWCRPEPPAPQ